MQALSLRKELYHVISIRVGNEPHPFSIYVEGSDNVVTSHQYTKPQSREWFHRIWKNLSDRSKSGLEELRRKLVSKLPVSNVVTISERLGRVKETLEARLGGREQSQPYSAPTKGVIKLTYRA